MRMRLTALIHFCLADESAADSLDCTLLYHRRQRVRKTREKCTGESALHSRICIHIVYTYSFAMVELTPVNLI